MVINIKFKLGRIIWTRGINDLVARNSVFVKFIMDSLKRHAIGEWGNLCSDDKKENEVAIEEGNRILSAYEADDQPKIWIITEADRSATTILFPDEY